MRQRLQLRGLAATVRVDSAGTHGYHVGEAPDPRTMMAAKRRGYDVSSQRARQLQPADLQVFDLILVADRRNLHAVQAMAAQHGGTRPQLFLSVLAGAVSEVPDPYYGGPDGFERVLDLVEQACDAWCDQICAKLQSKRDRPQAGLA